MALVTLILLGAGFACASGGFQPDVSAYDVTWNDPAYPGAEFGTASMPLGNGDAAANVWWHEGALFALLAKGDAWTEWHDLFKIGRLRASSRRAAALACPPTQPQRRKAKCCD